MSFSVTPLKLTKNSTSKQIRSQKSLGLPQNQTEKKKTNEIALYTACKKDVFDFEKNLPKLPGRQPFLELSCNMFHIKIVDLNAVLSRPKYN